MSDRLESDIRDLRQKTKQYFEQAIDIVNNGCYSTNRTKSVKEDTVDAVSSINM